jgi:uncharacterized membrane protein
MVYENNARTMSLTYQPFAETPAVERLSRDLQMNLSDRERIVSGVLGLGLAGAGLARDGFTRWALLLAGGALLQRSLSGHCRLYEKLELDRRHTRAGVPGNRGKRVESSVEIRCPAETLYSFWRDLEQLPRVMRHVKSVERRGNKRSHWTVAGPVGQTVEWDAEIINEESGRFIVWQSLPGATVGNAGSVWFEPSGDGVTRVKVAFEFDPPAGAIGVAAAELLGISPEADLVEDLQRFKEFAEAELKAAAQAT